MQTEPLDSPATVPLILLVEDNPLDAEVIRRMLGPSGFRVEVVERIGDAVASLASDGVDAILLDLTLPDSSGLDSARRVLEHANGRPLIVITGTDDEEIALQALAEGAQDYLIKGKTDAQTIQRAVRYAFERARADEALRASEERFRLLVENNADGISLLDGEGNVLYAAPALTRILGYPPEDYTKLNVFELIHPDDRAEARRRFDSNLSTMLLKPLRYRHRDGTWRYLEVIRRNHLDDPAVHAIIANYRDVTERIEAQEHAEQASRVSSLGRVAASVAHEFNNILMAIQPFAEVLRKRAPAEEALQKPIAQILEAVRRGKIVSQQILRFTTPAEPRLERLDLREWISNFSDEARAIAADRKVKVDGTEPLLVRADAGQLAQVMVNLVRNARDATAPAGEIVIGALPASSFEFLRRRLNDTNKYAAVFVQDRGVGIPPAILNRIFEPLFSTKRTGGTGLGLAVAQQIVARHSGCLLVDSRPGEGSTFFIALPLEHSR